MGSFTRSLTRTRACCWLLCLFSVCVWLRVDLTYRVALLDVVLAVRHELVRQLRDVHEAVHLDGEP